MGDVARSVSAIPITGKLLLNAAGWHLGDITDRRQLLPTGIFCLRLLRSRVVSRSRGDMAWIARNSSTR